MTYLTEKEKDFMNHAFHSGFVTIIGLPNVGKSSIKAW